MGGWAGRGVGDGAGGIIETSKEGLPWNRVWNEEGKFLRVRRKDVVP